jgi:hypothetical protein
LEKDRIPCRLGQAQYYNNGRYKNQDLLANLREVLVEKGILEGCKE